jgi:hypothetical protein
MLNVEVLLLQKYVLENPEHLNYIYNTSHVYYLYRQEYYSLGQIRAAVAKVAFGVARVHTLHASQSGEK